MALKCAGCNNTQGLKKCTKCGHWFCPNCRNSTEWCPACKSYTCK